MRGSKLDKIIEEELSSQFGSETSRDTIHIPKEFSENISRDSLKFNQTDKDSKFMAGSGPGQIIIHSSTNPNPNDAHLRENRAYSKFKSRIEIVTSRREVMNIKEISSFFEGKPRCVEDIARLESPFYRCTSYTIIRKKPIKVIPKEELRVSDNNAVLKRDKGAAIVDVKLANTLELRTFKSLFMTILQILNCIIRYTIVQYPFCMRYLGLVYGPIITSTVGAMSIFSIYMLLKINKVTGEKSYTAFAYKWWGFKGKIFMLILNSLSAFGSCLSYIIIFLKLIPNLLTIGTGASFLANKTVLSLILSMWLVIYCHQNDMSGIKAAAYWGVLGIVSFFCLDIVDLLLTSWNLLIPEDRLMNFISIDFYDYNVYSSIATVILSFNFLSNTFSIYDCLDSPDEKKMIITSSVGVFISTLIYLSVGTIGYILYGNKISDSLLDSMAYNNISILMCIFFVINVVMSFPITFNGLKHYVIFLTELIITLLRDLCCSKKIKDDEFLANNNNKTINEASDEDEDEDEGDFDEPKYDVKPVANHKMIQLPAYIEYVIVFGLFVLIFYTANKFPHIKTLFGFLGATTANLNTFILPALFYMKFSGAKFFSVSNILAMTFIAVGFIGLVVCLSSNILSLIRSQTISKA